MFAQGIPMFSHYKESPECQELRSGICASATAQSKVNRVRITQVKNKVCSTKVPSSCPIKEATREEEPTRDIMKIKGLLDSFAKAIGMTIDQRIVLATITCTYPPQQSI